MRRAIRRQPHSIAARTVLDADQLEGEKRSPFSSSLPPLLLCQRVKVEQHITRDISVGELSGRRRRTSLPVLSVTASLVELEGGGGRTEGRRPPPRRARQLALMDAPRGRGGVHVRQRRGNRSFVISTVKFDPSGDIIVSLRGCCQQGEWRETDGRTVQVSAISCQYVPYV